jgi:hypothetical protein
LRGGVRGGGDSRQPKEPASPVPFPGTT